MNYTVNLTLGRANLLKNVVGNVSLNVAVVTSGRVTPDDGCPGELECLEGRLVRDVREILQSWKAPVRIDSAKTTKML